MYKTSDNTGSSNYNFAHAQIVAGEPLFQAPPRTEKFVPLRGIEPRSQPSQGRALSVEL